MKMQLEIDVRLLARAKLLGQHESRSDAVNAALSEYISHRKQLGILELVGKVEWDPSYDYKEARRRKPARRISRN